MGSDVNKFSFRLVLLGSNGTGKTSILNRFLFSKFEPKHKPTVEDLFFKTFHLGSIEIKVDFLDTSGSMQFPAMRRLSITNGDAFLIVYSVDDQSSFEVVKMCLAEILEARPKDYQEVPIVFVGNKCDLPKEQRKVTKELVSNYVYYELPRLRTKVIECSCKDNTNIETIFKAYLSLARVTVPAPAVLVGSGAGPGGAASGLTSGGRSGGAGPGIGSSGGGGGSSNNNNYNNNNYNANNNHCGSGKRRPASAIPSEDSREGGRIHLAGSCKLALGVRKSCDASIISSMRKVSLSSTRNSREQLESMRETNQSQDQNSNSYQAGADNERDEDRPSSLEACQQKSSIESILKAAAIQQNQNHGANSSKLQVAHEAKPRSKSLIWRPTRKTSRSSSSSSGDQSECRVS